MPSNTSRQPKSNLLEFESNAYSKGFRKIAGVDEAGRGPLAGPVVAAACVIEQGVIFEGINDSKLLTPLRRNHFFKLLTSHPKVQYGVGIIDSETIDRLNIYQATLQAMTHALNGLPEEPDYVLIDGMMLSHRRATVEKVIGGDRLSQSIAAAGIIAKEKRDALMEEYHLLYPHYGFDRHKGYGTEEHVSALLEHGPCPWHRRSFEPLKGKLKKDGK